MTNAEPTTRQIGLFIADWMTRNDKNLERARWMPAPSGCARLSGALFGRFLTLSTTVDRLP